MPLIRVETSAHCDNASKDALAIALLKILAKTLAKPEAYTQALIIDGASISFGLKPGPAAFVMVKSIGGLSPELNASLSKAICAELESAIGVKSDRIYINFANVHGSDWGWNGNTFG